MDEVAGPSRYSQIHARREEKVGVVKKRWWYYVGIGEATTDGGGNR